MLHKIYILLKVIAEKLNFLDIFRVEIVAAHAAHAAHGRAVGDVQLPLHTTDITLLQHNMLYDD